MAEIKNKDKYLLELSRYILKECREFNPITIRIPKTYRKGDYTAQTDGKIVRVGDKFFELNVAEQIHKLLHISLHVSLRHHHRAREIADLPFALQVWNVATDTMINNAIKDYVKSKLRDTDSFSTAQFNFQVVDNIVSKELEKNLNEVSSEQVFGMLLKYTDRQDVDISQLKEIIENTENEFSKEDFAESSELLKGAGLESEDQDGAVQDLIWAKRLESAMKDAGSQAGNFLLELMGDLPKVKTPWDKLLRQFLTSRLMQERESNWKRPGRRYTAGVTDTFEPFRDRKKGIKKLVVCWDISGSCFDEATIHKFAANIEQIHKTTACKLVLVPFDTQVREEDVITISFHESFARIMEDKLSNIRGGGGTDFNAPIDWVRRNPADVAVVLTDGYQFGDWPAPLRIATLWATIGDPAPWGKTIFLED